MRKRGRKEGRKGRKESEKETKHKIACLRLKPARFSGSGRVTR